MTSDPIFTSDAEDDLRDIWFYVAVNGSVTAADKLIHELHETCRRFCEFPHIGTKRNFSSAKLRAIRSWPQGNYVIFYRPVNETIEIVRILHGMRDLDEIFRDADMAQE